MSLNVKIYIVFHAEIDNPLSYIEVHVLEVWLVPLFDKDHVFI